MSPTLRVLDIVKATTVDGPGFRTSVYLAGCKHHCPGCHNPQSWDPDGGVEMSFDEIMDIIVDQGNDVTLSGGDPLFHPLQIAALVARIRAEGLGVWLYTGYTCEEIASDKYLSRAVENVDVVVDGPFVERLRDRDLLFRGSANQRIMRVVSTGTGVTFEPWTDSFITDEI